MLISYKRGQTSIVLRIKILDSTVATGAGKTGLTSSSAGLIISTIADNEATATVYAQASGNIETITTLGTFATPTSSKCRFKEVDATNHKGVYEIQIADARFGVSSAKSLLISVSGATGAAETDAVIPLMDLDPYDSVRAGLISLPNAAAAASGGLLTYGSSTGQINPSSGKVPATLASSDVTGNVPCDVIAISGDTTAADNAELMFDGTGYAGGTVKLKVDLETIKTQAITCAAGVTVYAHVGTSAASTAQTGDSYAIVNSGTYGNSALKTLIDAVKTKTDYLPSATAGSAGGLLIAGSNAATTFATLTVTGALLVSGGTTLSGTSTGYGLTVNGGGTSGGAVRLLTTNGIGLYIAGTSGNQGILTTSDGHAVEFSSSSYGHGLLLTGANASNGVRIIGGTSGSGMKTSGGSTYGHGIEAEATVGNGAQFNAGTNGYGITAYGDGSGDGVYFRGGATGNGARLRGGATSGDGLYAESYVSGNGVTCIGGGTSGHGMSLMRGGVSGDDLNFYNNDVTIANVTTVNGLAANVITAASIHSDAGTEIATAVWANGTRTLTSVSGLTIDSNVVTINSVSTSSVTTINAHQGTTVAIPFTSTRPDVSVGAINGSVEAAEQQSRAARVVFNGSVTGATTTTTLIDSTLTQSANNHWNGRVVIFLTGSLKYQATDITAFDAATDKITFTALTSAPSGGDEYIIV